VGTLSTPGVAVAALVAALSRPASVPDVAVPGAEIFGYRVVNAYPHDADAYTQGLIYRDGLLYESTGLNGRSTLRKVVLETGQVVQRRPLAQEYFAEGLTDWGARLVQLTWQSHVGLVYDLASFQLLQSFPLTGEGWGLTHDEKALIVSDGSNRLRFLDPKSYREIKRVAVNDAGTAVTNLNELEYVRGQIYANVWHKDRVAMIAPETGNVTGWIDLSGLMSAGDDRDAEAVLNGIAYDSSRNRLFVTGKRWPRLFEISIVRH
jgi:glutamine cyclotransferase